MSEAVSSVEQNEAAKLDDEHTNKQESKLIEEENDDEMSVTTEKPCTSSSAMADSAASASKRNYLEVNATGKYKPFMLKPLETKRFKPSESLSKVKDFLPMLRESTMKLLDQFKQDPDACNIEHVGDDDEQHIELNLAMVSDHSDSDSDDDDDDDNDDDDPDESSEAESDATSESEAVSSGDEAENDQEEKSKFDELGLGFSVKSNKAPKIKLTSKQKNSKAALVQLIESSSAEAEATKPSPTE